MGKDNIQIFTRQIDNFVKLKYGAPKSVEGAYKRIKSNFKSFSMLYTIIAMILFFVATLFDGQFFSIFCAFTLFGITAILVDIFEPKVPIGDKKYPIKTLYAYILLLVITLLMAYFRGEISTLVKIGGVTLVLEIVHAVFAKEFALTF